MLTNRDFETRADKVDSKVVDLTPEEFVDWLIEYKGLPEGSKENVICNLREQFHWHELRGRLWRGTIASVLSVVIYKWLRIR